MSRYAKNLRPIYGENELTGPEQVQHGIGTAIDSYMQQRDTNRNERNAVAARGGVPMPGAPAPTVAGRIGDISRRVRGIFGGGETAPPQPGAADVNAGIVRGVGMPTPAPMQATAAAPPPQGTPGTMPNITGTQGSNPVAMQHIGDALGASHPAIASTGAAPVMPSAMPSGRPAANGAPQRGIGGALSPYTYESANGDKYQMDPLHDARVKDGLDTEKEEAAIASLISTGMDPNIARAKVLNKVVRYDETFGQKSRGGGVSQKDWAAREAQRQADRKEMELLRAQGRISSSELQRRRLDLQEQEAQDRRERLTEGNTDKDVKNNLNIATVAGKQVPTGVNAAMATPEEKAQAQRAAAIRDKALKGAVTGQERRANAHATQATAAAEYAKYPATMSHADRVADMRRRGFR